MLAQWDLVASGGKRVCRGARLPASRTHREEGGPAGLGQEEAGPYRPRLILPSKRSPGHGECAGWAV